MNDAELFSRALGLQEPWQVGDVRFDAEQRRLDLRIDFPKDSRFACPECGREGCPGHDTELKTWRQLNFL
jgi:transposase